MGDTTIEWTAGRDGRPGRTWNGGVFGCSHDGPECLDCYAQRMAHRQVAMGNYPAGITHKGRHGPEFTGVVVADPKAATAGAEQLGTARGGHRFVFVSSMSDVAHALVPDEHLVLLFKLMRDRWWLTFLVLSKRAGRILELARTGVLGPWPVNVWLGTTAGNQRQWMRRALPMAQRAAHVDALAMPDVGGPQLFVSCEPLLGPITAPINPPVWGRRSDGAFGCNACCTGTRCAPRGWGCTGEGPALLRWGIGGGELGKRPTHPEWARRLRDAMIGAGMAFTWKQWGSWLPESELQHHPAEVVAALHVVERRDVDSLLPGVPPARMLRVVGRSPIRTLDGVTWDQRPFAAGEVTTCRS